MKRNLILVLLICWFFGLGNCFAGLSLKLAPINPEFLKWKKLKVKQLKTKDGHPLGHIPAPFVIFPKDKKINVNKKEIQVLPERFDLRDVNGVTPVRDQGYCGSCWTFATMASLESYIKYKFGYKFDFSEQDLNKNHGFSFSECEGGNAFMSTAYLARWQGPIRESDMPYPYSYTYNPVAHIQDVYFLPVNIDLIKKAVYYRGSVYIAFDYEDQYYNSSTSSYYNPNSDWANHAVAIVGWDDNFPKENFAIQPPADGAFIVKNSWGEEWGENGYFYLSYYDKTLEEATGFLEAERPVNYSKKYGYDPLGLVVALGIRGENPPNIGWMANVFETDQNARTIKAVSFYAVAPNVRYDIYIVDNVKDSPSSGNVVKHISGRIPYGIGGYFTVKVGNVYINGDKFCVVVKLINPEGWDYPIPLEIKYPGYSDAATSAPGQSFVTDNPKNGWEDLYYGLPDYFPNACIKVFAE